MSNRRIGTFTLDVSILLLLILIPLNTQAGFDEDSVRYLTLYRKKICDTAALTGIPPESLAGVIVAERTLNNGLFDNMQNVFVGHLLKAYNNTWWEEWAKSSETLATEMMNLRLISNKWPLELSKNGYVMSVGPAQITPRTAIRACEAIDSDVEACRGGVKGIVSNLLDFNRSIELAAAVLVYESLEYNKNAETVEVLPLALLGTLYNIGGEYYSKTFVTKFNTTTNSFGKWIERNAELLKKSLKCNYENGSTF